MKSALRLILILLLALGVAATAFKAGDSARDEPQAAARGEASVEDRLGPLPAVPVAELPPEARETLERIHRGGPFPYPKDGALFHNRERLLPVKPRNYYREYTVPTPGVRTRGARRIVVGAQGEAYYTDDHYRSFKRIVESP